MEGKVELGSGGVKQVTNAAVKKEKKTISEDDIPLVSYYKRCLNELCV